MQPYQRTRQRREKTANVTGVIVTLGAHALALVVLLTSGLKYLDPPPPERTSLLIEFDLSDRARKRASVRNSLRWAPTCSPSVLEPICVVVCVKTHLQIGRASCRERV